MNGQDLGCSVCCFASALGRGFAVEIAADAKPFTGGVFYHCWCGSSFKKLYPAEKSGEHDQKVGAQQPDARMKSSTSRLFSHVLPIAIPLGRHPLEAPDHRIQRLSFSGFLSPSLSSRRTILSFRNAIFARYINFAIS
jgi:hypothetical protein